MCACVRACVRAFIFSVGVDGINNVIVYIIPDENDIYDNIHTHTHTHIYIYIYIHIYIYIYICMYVIICYFHPVLYKR